MSAAVLRARSSSSGLHVLRTRNGVSRRAPSWSPGGAPASPPASAPLSGKRSRQLLCPTAGAGLAQRILQGRDRRRLQMQPQFRPPPQDIYAGACPFAGHQIIDLALVQVVAVMAAEPVHAVGSADNDIGSA